MSSISPEDFGGVLMGSANFLDKLCSGVVVGEAET
jgi:hypothetical protein